VVLYVDYVQMEQQILQHVMYVDWDKHIVLRANNVSQMDEHVVDVRTERQTIRHVTHAAQGNSIVAQPIHVKTMDSLVADEVVGEVFQQIIVQQEISHRVIMIDNADLHQYMEVHR